MEIKHVLVAIADGEFGSDGVALAKGSIREIRHVPVQVEFYTTIGRATVYPGDSVGNVYADLDIADLSLAAGRHPEIANRYPAIGFHSDEFVRSYDETNDERKTVTHANVVVVSFGDKPNTDPRIGRFNGRGEQERN